MNLSHPLSITLCEVIIDRYNLDAFTGEGI